MCGGRDWNDRVALRSALDDALADCPDGMMVVEGCARGADRIASAWADNHAPDGVLHARFPARWDLYGKRAGPLRNADMLRYLLAQRDENGADIGILAFHDDLAKSRGTGDMVRRAEAAGVIVGRFSHAR